MHRPEAEVKELTWCLVVTSDRVYKGEVRDEVTPLVEKLVERHGWRLKRTYIVPNDAARIQHAVLDSIVSGCDVILVTGGTGPRPRDISVDAIARLADRELPGLGELFRRLSYEEIGARAYISRASVYIVHGVPVAISPGSPDAVRLMVEKVLAPVIGHVVYELRR